jgi:hypothetical protein
MFRRVSKFVIIPRSNAQQDVCIEVLIHLNLKKVYKYILY